MNKYHVYNSLFAVTAIVLFVVVVFSGERLIGTKKVAAIEPAGWQMAATELSRTQAVETVQFACVPQEARLGQKITFTWQCLSADKSARTIGFDGGVLPKNTATITTQRIGKKIYGIECSGGHAKVCAVDVSGVDIRLQIHRKIVKKDEPLLLVWNGVGAQGCAVYLESFSVKPIAQEKRGGRLLYPKKVGDDSVRVSCLGRDDFLYEKVIEFVVE